MKNVKKLLITGLIVGCTIANIFAMEDDKMRAAQNPEAAVAVAEAASKAEGNPLAPTTENIGYWSTLPDDLLVDILAQYIGDDLFSEADPKGTDQDLFLERIRLAITKLKNLRLINKRLANLLTRQAIIYILKNVYIVTCVNTIDPNTDEPLLLSKNVNIVTCANKPNPETGETLLHRAVRTEKIELAKFLIEAGVDINAPLITPRSPKFTKYFPIGSTPLHIAVKMGYADIVSLLIQHGADITAATSSDNPNLNNLTPLDIARRHETQALINILKAAYQARDIPVPAVEVRTVPPCARRLDFQTYNPKY